MVRKHRKYTRSHYKRDMMSRSAIDLGRSAMTVGIVSNVVGSVPGGVVPNFSGFGVAYKTVPTIVGAKYVKDMLKKM